MYQTITTERIVKTLVPNESTGLNFNAMSLLEIEHQFLVTLYQLNWTFSCTVQH